MATNTKNSIIIKSAFSPERLGIVGCNSVWSIIRPLMLNDIKMKTKFSGLGHSNLLKIHIEQKKKIGRSWHLS